jgi:hypothetical protein
MNSPHLCQVKLTDHILSCLLHVGMVYVEKKKLPISVVFSCCLGNMLVCGAAT